METIIIERATTAIDVLIGSARGAVDYIIAHGTAIEPMVLACMLDGVKMVEAWGLRQRPCPPAEAGSRRAALTVPSENYSERCALLAAHLHDFAIALQNELTAHASVIKKISYEEFNTYVRPIISAKVTPLIARMLDDITEPFIDLRNDDMLDFSECTISLSVVFAERERERQAARHQPQAEVS